MIYPVIFFKYSNIIPDTTELAVFENASPRVRCEAGSKGLDSTSSLAKAFSTIFWEMVTPNPLFTKAMISVRNILLINAGYHCRSQVFL